MTTSTLFATSTGIYSLAGLNGLDIHVFATEEGRAAWVAQNPEARQAITESEAQNLAPQCRHWEYHEEVWTKPEAIAWTRGYGASFSFNFDEAPALAFGW